MRRAFGVAVAGLVGLAGASAAVSAVSDTKAFGTTGPGFSITLKDANGRPVTKLDAGEVEIEVDDLSEEHNFHLIGPGVDVRTAIETTGKQTFRVSLVDGRYTFQCDPHAAVMKGAFQVGNAPPPPPPPTTTPKPAAAPSAPVGARLALTVGPTARISLSTLGGKRVSLLRPGAYTFVVRDRSKSHNAHVRGAGAKKSTGVGFVGTATWRVVLRNGTLVVQCDKHRTTMRTTVRVA